MSDTSYSKLYGVYKHMKERCYNKNHRSYHNYGGRGIKVCDEWLHNFVNFCIWAIGNGYTVGLEIDRIDNNKGYSPDNCRWATRKQQANNRRTNVLLTYNGKTQTMKQWAEELNIPYDTIKRRRLRGCNDVNSLLSVDKLT